jgi:hypothetical protein
MAKKTVKPVKPKAKEPSLQILSTHLMDNQPYVVIRDHTTGQVFGIPTSALAYSDLIALGIPKTEAGTTYDELPLH